MAEPLKNLINAQTVETAARKLQAVWPGFDAHSFQRLALQDLDALEFKARALRLCTALQATLSADFDTAAGHIEACLQGSDALQGWVLWPFGEFVARTGLQQPERALPVLHALTQRFTAEFAIRPFIVQHPELVFRQLARWVRDPNEHVRRLVSEGSRPRLPWGLRLQALVLDPSPALPLLEALQDDPSEVVRRSVANHLNDIAKDHPDLVSSWLHTHLPSASPERRALLRHASRSLIKQGHGATLLAWGLGQAFQGRVRLALAPRRIVLGESLALTLDLASTAAQPQRLEIDYAVHHVKADGSTTAKVFKGWRVELPAHGRLHLAKRHAVRPITTRRYYPGRHVLDIRINGQIVADAAFSLALASPAVPPGA